MPEELANCKHLEDLYVVQSGDEYGWAELPEVIRQMKLTNDSLNYSGDDFGGDEDDEGDDEE